MTNKGKDYKDRQNDKRRIIYWLEHNNFAWIAKILKRAKGVK